MKKLLLSTVFGLSLTSSLYAETFAPTFKSLTLEEAAKLEFVDMANTLPFGYAAIEYAIVRVEKDSSETLSVSIDNQLAECELVAITGQNGADEADVVIAFYGIGDDGLNTCEVTVKGSKKMGDTKFTLGFFINH